MISQKSTNSVLGLRATFHCNVELIFLEFGFGFNGLFGSTVHSVLKGGVGKFAQHFIPDVFVLHC